MLVRSKQSMQLVRVTPVCVDVTVAAPDLQHADNVLRLLHGGVCSAEHMAGWCAHGAMVARKKLVDDRALSAMSSRRAMTSMEPLRGEEQGQQWWQRQH